MQNCLSVNHCSKSGYILSRSKLCNNKVQLAEGSNWFFSQKMSGGNSPSWICPSCHTDLKGTDGLVVVDELYPEYSRVICAPCKKTVGILRESSDVASDEDFPATTAPAKLFATLDDILNSPDGVQKDGICLAESSLDRLILYVLSQIIYCEQEGPDEKEDEFEFALPPATDMAKIMWVHGEAVGFYTAKPKGSLDTETMQVYSMVTLDTIFVRRSYRRRGLASDSVVNLSREFSPPNNIGFSYPLSKGMLRVLKRHLEKYPRDRERFWAITGCGLQGNCSNLWLIFQRKRKEEVP